MSWSSASEPAGEGEGFLVGLVWMVTLPLGLGAVGVSVRAEILDLEGSVRLFFEAGIPILAVVSGDSLVM